MRFRWIHKQIALNLGYFWLPCPNCEQMFSGYEWTYSTRRSAHKTSIPDPTYDPPNLSRGVGICPDCVKSGVGCVAWLAVEPYILDIKHQSCEFLKGVWRYDSR